MGMRKLPQDILLLYYRDKNNFIGLTHFKIYLKYRGILTMIETYKYIALTTAYFNPVKSYSHFYCTFILDIII